MTRQTGWVGEEPQEPGVGGFAGFILANRAAPDTGRTLEQVLARAKRPDKPPEPVDPDDRMSAMVARGYRPGLIGQLSQQLGDTTAELEAEREKLEKGKRRAEIAAREHASGRADVWQMQRMMDGDFGDEGRVAMLERRAQSLGRQISEAQEMTAPPAQRDLDPVESATRRAHEAFVAVTRAAWEAAQSGTARPAPRPFSVSRGAGQSTDHTGPDCQICAAAREQDAARDRALFASVYPEAVR